MSIEMKGNSYQRQKMPNLVQVDRDDIMQQDLPVGEEVPFVSVYFGDYTDSYSALRTNASVVGGQLNPELSRDGSHIVWVENARTGELLPTLLGNANSANDDDNDGDRDNADGDGEIDEKSPLIVPKPLDDSVERATLETTQLQLIDQVEHGDASGHSYAALLLRGIFLLFQGMLAGFNFISVSYLVLSDASFLSTYQASANEVRRLSFILSTLAALGAVDNLMTLISRSRRPSLGGEKSGYGSSLVMKENGGAFIFAFSACALYLVSLVLTVLLGGTDVLIFYKFGYDDETDWVSSSISEYSEEIQTWRKLVATRIAVTAVGWVCSCFLVWKDLVAKEGRGHELVRLQGVITQWRHRVDMMEGSSLEGMQGPALRKLVALQGLGYERTNAALRVVDQL